jgi:hypothetical protein
MVGGRGKMDEGRRIIAFGMDDLLREWDGWMDKKLDGNKIRRSEAEKMGS